MNYKVNQSGFSSAIGLGLLAILLITGVLVYSLSGGDNEAEDDTKLAQEQKDLMDYDSDGDGLIDDLETSLETAPENNNPVIELEENNLVEELTPEMEIESKVGRYIDYSQNEFLANQESKRLLFFHASWCPSCRTADSGITESINDIPGNLVILKVNYDRENELKEKYGVTYQHTFVQVDSQGNELNKWNGGGINEILANLK